MIRCSAFASITRNALPTARPLATSASTVRRSTSSARSSVTAEVMLKRGVKRALVLGLRGVGYALHAAGIETVFPGEPNASDHAPAWIILS